MSHIIVNPTVNVIAVFTALATVIQLVGAKQLVTNDHLKICKQT